MSDTTNIAAPAAPSAAPANEPIDWDNISMDDDDKPSNTPGTEPPGAAGTSTPPTDNNTPPADQPDALTPAQELLAAAGFEGNMVEYGGEIVDINTLEPVAQLDIAKQLLLAANERQPELEGDAKHLVDLLKSGLSPKDIARQILGPELEGSANSLTDDQVATQILKQQFTKFSDAQIAAELEDIKGRPNYDAKVAMWREQVAEQGKPDLAALSAQQTEALRAANEAEQARIVQAVAPMDKVMNLFELNDEQKNYILADLVEVEDNGHTRFVNMQEDPQTQFEMRYAHAFLPQIVQHFQSFAQAEYQRGRDEALGNAPTNPIVPGGGAAPQQQRQAAPAPKNNSSAASDFDDDAFGKVDTLG